MGVITEGDSTVFRGWWLVVGGWWLVVGGIWCYETL